MDANREPSAHLRLVVFGANGPTGRLLVRQALDAGHTVTAFTRRPESYPSMDGDLHVHGGDVADPMAVQAAVAGHDAVVSALGVPFGKEPVSVYSAGMTNILAAMSSQGVKRLIAVTSSTMGPHPTPQGGFVFRKIMQPYVVNTLGRTIYDDMRRMEALMVESDVEWTIVRPSGLFIAGSVSAYETAENAILGRFTAREDLAACLLSEVDDRRHIGQVLAVVTTAVKPNMAKLIWREAIRKQD